MRKFTPLLVLAAVVAGVVGIGGPSVAGADAHDRYIIVLRDEVSDARGLANEHSRRHRAKVSHVYQSALKGYAAAIPAGEMGALRSDRRVAYVEPDGVAFASAVTQTDATWGLDRTDQRSGLDTSFTYTATGAGVHAYIIDTGIRVSHSDFGGRAVSGYDAVDGDFDADDCNGHGTHVAGTVGGSAYGVAKGVTLVAVRVLNCSGSGTWSGVIAGIDWVTANAAKPAVANMSLGGGANSAVDTAVRNSITSGVTYAVAAGNGNTGGVAQDACKYSPARVAEAMTISATNNTDTKASWANYGKCVDWFAPGVSITSAWYTDDSATKTISGTSMATPHTAGVAALHLESDTSATASAVRDSLYGKTTKGVVKKSRTTNNHLLFTDL